MSSNHATPTSPATRECARMRPLLPLQGRGLLGADVAERLSGHVNACQRCQAELAAYARLDAALRRTVAAAPAMPIQAEEIMAQDEARTDTISAALPSARDWESVPRYRRPRPLATALGAVAALIVVALFARLLLSHGPMSHTGAQLGLPEPTATIHYDPRQFVGTDSERGVWFAPAPASEHDPRVVFANNLRVPMCPSPPDGAVSVTWLTTSPTFGLALVEANCGGTLKVAQVALYSRMNGVSCARWSAMSNIVDRPTDTKPLPFGEAGSIPSWLPLPHQSYIDQHAHAPAGAMAEQIYTDWLYADHTYAAGRYVGQAYEPASAREITLSGHAGWVTTDGSYTTLTFPLAGGQTFFFSQTGSQTGNQASAQPLAETVLAHLDMLLPNVGIPAAQPGFSC